MLGRLPALLASLDRLADPFAFATRVYVGWQFFKSGMLKIGSWESTLGLFQDEYHVPLLPPALAAVAGTAGELFFPVLLVSVSSDGSAQSASSRSTCSRSCPTRTCFTARASRPRSASTIYGASCSLMLAIYGPGGWSVDRWLAPRLGSPRRW